MKNKLYFIVFIFILGSNITNAQLLSFEFIDPTNDRTRSFGIDLVSVSVVFDNTNGDYEILLTADPASPFVGNFRINSNMVNPDTNSFTMVPSYFFDNANDFRNLDPVTTISLTGNNSNLTYWNIGDRVATSSVPFGLATDALEAGIGDFASEITDYLDFSIYSSDYFPNEQVAYIQAVVPLPTSLYLLISGLLGITSIALKRQANKIPTI